MDWPARVTGRPAAWARDLAIVGAATGALAPGGVLVWVASAHAVLYCALAAIVGGASGAVLGASAPAALDALRRRLRLRWVAALALPVGAAWGALAAAAPFWLLLPSGYASRDVAESVALMGAVGAVAGAVQLGWVWLAYAVMAMTRRSTWPVVAAAALGAPSLGWLGTYAVLLVGGALFGL